MAIPSALTVSASDSSGCDGVQADLRTFAALRVHGASAITAVTAQNTLEVTAAQMMPTELVEAQIATVRADMPLGAIKLGALGTAEVIEAVTRLFSDCELAIVADPVLAAKSGDVLVEPETVEAYVAHVLPLATVVTPNLAEAALLTSTERATTLGDMISQGETLSAAGVPHALICGGHGSNETCTDILFSRDRPPIQLRGPRHATENVRGASATLSAAICAHIAHGIEAYEAMQYAKLFISGAIEASDSLRVGAGPGPVYQMYRAAPAGSGG